jgi:hypothetical protein
MDDLRTTLLTLGPDDRREFGQFMQRQRRKTSGRQDVRLYELLLRPKELTTAQLVAKLYPDEPNPVAYYALRKRLLRHLMDYLLLRQRQQDATAATSVHGQLTMAQYLFEVGIPRLAWAMLRKAEKLAQANEQYEPLNAVYNLQIQFADSPHAEPLEEIIRRRHHNKKAADEEERANIADSLLRLRLREARTKGRAALPFDTIMQQILKEYDLQDAFARSPSLLCRLMSIARSAMLVRRDFASFAPFIERCYRLMERRHGFAPAQRGYQLRLLYMLAHALYRARRFADSVAYLEQGQLLLEQPGARQATLELGSRFTFLLAANYAFLQRNAESIELLEKALRTRAHLSEREELTARLQLAFHQFAENQFAKANQNIIRLDRSDHWLEQHMGLEWLLKKSMGEMLILCELGHSDLALVRLKALERTLRERFPATEGTADAPAVPIGGAYRYVLYFLSMVREILDDPDVAQHPDFRLRMRQMPAMPPAESEDLQSQSFFAWLRARTEGRPYYQVLLEVAGAG